MLHKLNHISRLFCISHCTMLLIILAINRNCGPNCRLRSLFMSCQTSEKEQARLVNWIKNPSLCSSRKRGRGRGARTWEKKPPDPIFFSQGLSSFPFPRLCLLSRLQESKIREHEYSNCFPKKSLVKQSSRIIPDSQAVKFANTNVISRTLFAH